MRLWRITGDATQRAAATLRALARDARGNVAMMFALTMPILLMMIFAGVDIHRASTAKTQLQDALDAATLAAARSPFVRPEDIQRVGLNALNGNLRSGPNMSLVADSAVFTLNDDIVVGRARINVQALVANIFLPPYGAMSDEYIQVGGRSEVDRSARNIEVALVLDITGSMDNCTRNCPPVSKLQALKTAAKDLIDIVVQQEQTPYFSRVSLVPYSMGVNLGSAANGARGAPIGSRAISNISWATGSTRTVTGVTRANPATVTANGHGFQNGDKVVIWNASGMTQLNDRVFTVANRTNNTFRLSGVNSSSWGSFSGSAQVAKCARTDCAPTVTADAHGLSTGEYVYLTDIGGMTQLNRQTLEVTVVNGNSYRLDTVGSRVFSGSNGKSWCTREGCTYYAFANMYGTLTTHQISSCVTERTGSAAYTDASPSSARVGRNYPGASNPCLRAPVTQLSSSRTGLKSDIDAYVAEGSTAGQIGIAWGWYMVSPEFNGLWSGGFSAAPYNTAETLKAVVIMTDGEFNTPYCRGVIAQNAGTGSGANEEKINCNGTNGDPFVQSRRLCDGMRARGVIVYTVGFQIASGGDAESVLRYCASTPANFYLPSSGGDLTDAFSAIGRDITKLRISR